MSADLLIRLGLALLTVAVYGQVAGHEFLNYDDPLHVTANPLVRAGLTAEGIRWAFTTLEAENWHPLMWLSHMLDCQLFGVHAGAHLLVNVAFHVANTLLLFEVLRRMTGARWSSALVAGLFALHPAHVESVAWVSERKDVLSTFFWLLTMAAYHRYVLRPSLGRYLLVALGLALGLMSKPMVVTLPFVLLLLDVWPLGRRLDARVVAEKVPLLLLVAATAAVTIVAQQQAGAVAVVSKLPVTTRLANAVVAYVRYLGTLVWPVDLALIYPLHLPIPAWQVVGAAAILLAITALVLWAGRRRPYLAVGWLWYLGTLVPVIGLVQVGEQSMADRYTYVPFIGLFIVVAWGVPDLLPRRRWREPALAGLAAGALAACAVLTVRQAARWRDSITLLEHTIAVTTDNDQARFGLGLALVAAGRPADAVPHFREAVRIWPGYVQAHRALARALTGLGQADEATAAWTATLAADPASAEAHLNLGILLAQQGRFAEAEPHLARAGALDPDNPQAHYNLGLALAAQGRTAGAVAALRDAVRISPHWPAPAMQLAWSLATAADPAVRAPADAVALAEPFAGSSDDPDPLDTLAAAYAAAGRFDDAVRTAERALERARATGQGPLAEEIEGRLAGYRAGRPFVVEAP